MKRRLVELEHQGTGRIRLSRFYAGAAKGDWSLSESEAFLRNLGVLEETDPSKPSVVIANYMQSSPIVCPHLAFTPFVARMNARA